MGGQDVADLGVSTPGGVGSARNLPWLNTPVRPVGLLPLREYQFMTTAPPDASHHSG
jgi:hypothetical protein